MSVKPLNGFRLLLNKLRRRIPKELIRQREQGGEFLDYIEWTTAADIMDDVVGRWQNYIKSVEVVGDKLIIIGGVKIKDPETGEWLSRENVGIEKIATNSYGDVASNAFAMMFKRAIVLWGPGRELYKAPNYAPHKLATDEQIQEIIHLMNEGKIPEEYHDPIIKLINSGELEAVRAQSAIAKFGSNGSNGKDTKRETKSTSKKKKSSKSVVTSKS